MTKTIYRHTFAGLPLISVTANAAGEDLDCQRGFHDNFSYGNTLPTAVTQGITTQTDIYIENDMDVSPIMSIGRSGVIHTAGDGAATVPPP